MKTNFKIYIKLGLVRFGLRLYRMQKLKNKIYMKIYLGLAFMPVVLNDMIGQLK